MYNFVDDLNLSATDLLSLIDQKAAIEWVIGESITIDKTVRNPFRAALDVNDVKYDSNPKCKFTYWNNNIVLVDFAYTEYHSINVILMAQKQFKCNYY